MRRNSSILNKQYRKAEKGMRVVGWAMVNNTLS